MADPLALVVPDAPAPPEVPEIGINVPNFELPDEDWVPPPPPGVEGGSAPPAPAIPSPEPEKPAPPAPSPKPASPATPAPTPAPKPAAPTPPAQAPPAAAPKKEWPPKPAGDDTAAKEAEAKKKEQEAAAAKKKAEEEAAKKKADEEAAAKKKAEEEAKKKAEQEAAKKKQEEEAAKKAAEEAKKKAESDAAAAKQAEEAAKKKQAEEEAAKAAQPAAPTPAPAPVSAPAPPTPAPQPPVQQPPAIPLQQPSMAASPPSSPQYAGNMIPSFMMPSSPMINFEAAAAANAAANSAATKEVTKAAAVAAKAVASAEASNQATQRLQNELERTESRFQDTLRSAAEERRQMQQQLSALHLELQREKESRMLLQQESKMVLHQQQKQQEEQQHKQQEEHRLALERSATETNRIKAETDSQTRAIEREYASKIETEVSEFTFRNEILSQRMDIHYKQQIMDVVKLEHDYREWEEDRQWDHFCQLKSDERKSREVTFSNMKRRVALQRLPSNPHASENFNRLAAMGAAPSGGTYTTAAFQAVHKKLQELDLVNYAPVFSANEFDLNCLRHLTESDLDALGITSLGARKRLLLEAEKMRMEQQQQQMATDAYTEAGKVENQLQLEWNTLREQSYGTTHPSEVAAWDEAWARATTLDESGVHSSAPGGHRGEVLCERISGAPPPDSSSSLALPPPPPPPPPSIPSWVTYYTAEGIPYYHNTTTGETSWTH